MKLIVQRVARATVEVDGFLEQSIRSGLVLLLALKHGDVLEHAQQLATKVLKLLLWPDPVDDTKLWNSSVVDNSYEILAICQPSLCSTFSKLAPKGDSAMKETEAKEIFDAFVEKLKAGYQDEMVSKGPFGDGASTQVELTHDGPCIFELDTEGAAPSTLRAPPVVVDRAAQALATLASEMDEAEEQAYTKANAAREAVDPSMGPVTKALQRLALMKGNKATLESCKVFQILSTQTFRDNLAESSCEQTDAFAEALEKAAGIFSRKQQNQICEWTGLVITAPPKEDSQNALAGTKRPAAPSHLSTQKRPRQ
eukprot:gnl/TRDRNA2_/TRDRNA2_42271_c0_seq1.p1 gnl/TRDRNA2_/TRDRNA2_42271_c0~~gnl/TRDRNA2_/TRDRNA2_42271_c0_seq1.p1  ORF type:complete len:311 (+),score=65.39 gnl/TRDRNA2_/TRDRNA2_42271_c0_seq1:84-1016(+)